MPEQRLNPRTVVRDDGTITVDDVALARWRVLPADELPHVRREVAKWIESLQAIARGGVDREQRLRRERRAMQLLPLVVDILDDAPDEPGIDLPIAKDIVAYWHFGGDHASGTTDRPARRER